ncbi:site-specific DNA-methyltransferase [uncultured Varibaculum sp.]|uniref:site-specific DNA-methyltransferase n=1 Tax=uncultured Varibaculum sp. TaxID=413896 RepID=UPI00280628DB|nr:site-specific DNA-methyltransferase [uncultured Varibaculum sp.]
MIRDAHGHNETVKPNDFEVQRLREALPEYFDKDGTFMFDRLQNALRGGDVDLSREGYELKFLGKSYAKYLTSTETETVVVPDLPHNAEPENEKSENLYIVGDNLDALKHLLGSYAGEVKCIYIDPPYNTGSDGFIYNDDFGFTTQQLVDKIGLDEEEAQRVLGLRGKSSHSAWLTLMYPRLQLAKELLANDGAIFISIDDNEYTNLKAACDEIFGEQNHVSTVVIQTNPRGRTFDRFIAKTHEYLLVYSLDETSEALALIPKDNKALASYAKFDDGGQYRLLELRNRNPVFNRSNRPNLFYAFYADPKSGEVSLEPDERHIQPIYPRNSEGADGCWTWGEQKARENIGSLVGHQASTGKWTVFRKDYLRPESKVTKSKGLWLEPEMNHERGKERVRELFGYTPFDFPKSVGYLKKCILLGARDGSITLDFFSGSATTADAVMQLNAEDNGTRRYIMVQLPEEVDEDTAAYQRGYRTIDEIGRERIRRAAEKIKSETNADIDYGFKLFRLDEPSEKVLDQLESFDPEAAEGLFAGDYVSKFDLNGTPGHDTVLATWLLRDGFGLTGIAEKVTLASYQLDVCGDSGYVISPGLTSDDVVALVSLLENGSLGLSRIAIFNYSVDFSVMHELKKNLSVLKSGKTVSVIERF